MKIEPAGETWQFSIRDTSPTSRERGMFLGKLYTNADVHVLEYTVLATSTYGTWHLYAKLVAQQPATSPQSRR